LSYDEFIKFDPTWPRGWGDKQLFGVNHLISILKLVSAMFPNF